MFRDKVPLFQRCLIVLQTLNSQSKTAKEICLQPKNWNRLLLIRQIMERKYRLGNLFFESNQPATSGTNEYQQVYLEYKTALQRINTNI
jgi:hypothetical protein